VIENDRELEHFNEMLRSLDRLGRELTPEEKALDALLARPIADYDEKIDLPELSHETIAFLMRQKDLKQADLLPVFGSRSVASDVRNGKREPSKAHIRRLAESFPCVPGGVLLS
jgi:HTH-type transcriptional regulator / antitoxin HigA